MSQVRIKVTLQVSPQTRGMSVRGNHVPQELNYDRVFTLHGGVKRFGPYLLKGPPNDNDDLPDEGNHFFKIPLDNIDTTKMHVLMVEFDDKWDDPTVFAALGAPFTQLQESRSFGLLALRKGVEWGGGNAPITGPTGQQYRLNKAYELDLTSPVGIGSLDCQGLWYVGPILFLNPRFDADECVLIPVIVGGGDTDVAEYWGSCYVTLMELKETWEDVYAAYPEVR